jgi:hypothetical protein
MLARIGEILLIKIKLSSRRLTKSNRKSPSGSKKIYLLAFGGMDKLFTEN